MFFLLTSEKILRGALRVLEHGYALYTPYYTFYSEWGVILDADLEIAKFT